jgi:hypothetical protein
MWQNGQCSEMWVALCCVGSTALPDASTAIRLLPSAEHNSTHMTGLDRPSAFARAGASAVNDITKTAMAASRRCPGRRKRREVNMLEL